MGIFDFFKKDYGDREPLDTFICVPYDNQPMQKEPLNLKEFKSIEDYHRTKNEQCQRQIELEQQKRKRYLDSKY